MFEYLFKCIIFIIIYIQNVFKNNKNQTNWIMKENQVKPSVLQGVDTDCESVHLKWDMGQVYSYYSPVKKIKLWYDIWYDICLTCGHVTKSCGAEVSVCVWKSRYLVPQQFSSIYQDKASVFKEVAAERAYLGDCKINDSQLSLQLCIPRSVLITVRIAKAKESSSNLEHLSHASLPSEQTCFILPWNYIIQTSTSNSGSKRSCFQ